MPTVISAKHYADSTGFRRTVIMVRLNPSAPPWLHPNGTIAPAGHTGEDTPTKPGCPLCRDNRKIEEYVWTGPQLDTVDSDGTTRSKTTQELLEEISTTLATPPAPTVLTEALSQTL